MTLLAIDPGPTRSAWVTLDGDLGVNDKGIMFNEDLLTFVTFASSTSSLAIEMIESFGMPVGKEVFQTVFWIGRFVQAWEPKPWTLVYRKEVKLHLCASPHAKDANIRAALLDKLGPQGTKKAPGSTYGIKADIWSALAVGVTWMETKR